MRRLSLNARMMQDDLVSDQIYVVLIEIDHPELPRPIRLSTDNADRIQADPPIYGTRSSWRGANPITDPIYGSSPRPSCLATRTTPRPPQPSPWKTSTARWCGWCAALPRPPRWRWRWCWRRPRSGRGRMDRPAHRLGRHRRGRSAAVDQPRADRDGIFPIRADDPRPLSGAASVSWSDRYIGTPYAELGRSLHGCDCWGWPASSTAVSSASPCRIIWAPMARPRSMPRSMR